jgi:hypothetical protein
VGAFGAFGVALSVLRGVSFAFASFALAFARGGTWCGRVNRLAIHAAPFCVFAWIDRRASEAVVDLTLIRVIVALQAPIAENGRVDV